MWQDLVFTLRILRKSPGFTAVALLTLVMGIGANVAMFAVTNTVLFRPLPYQNADRLLFLTSEDPTRGLVGLNVSYTRYVLLQQQSMTLESVGAAFVPWSSSIVLGGNAEQVPSAIASRSLFDVLGVSPAYGRAFLPDEDAAGGASVALISDAFWHSHFGGNATVLGETFPIDGRSVQIIGILPATFRFPFAQPEPAVWLPRPFENPLFQQDRIRTGAAYLTAYARMRPGETVEHVQAELASLGASYAKAFPNFSDAPRLQLRATGLKESIVGPVRYSVVLLLAGVGLVLLIGCVNLASLLLARSNARRKEIAVRQALGASSKRLARQFLTESFALSFAGGVIGLLLASETPRLLTLLPAGTLPRLEEVTIDARVILVSFVLCMLTGIAFGLAPLFASRRVALFETLKDAARGSSGGTSAGRSQGALVVCEVAIALILINSAGLLMKSFGKLTQVNPGFDPTSVTSFSYSLPPLSYPTRLQQGDFNRRVAEAMAAIPQVESAGLTTYLPIGGGIRFVYFCGDNIPCLGVGKDPVAAVRQITPEYFNVMRIPLLRGRPFNEHDNASSHGVCVINDTLAGQFFPGLDPIGRHLIQTRGNISLEIVGVVSSVRFAGLSATYLPELYLPQEQSPLPLTTMSLVVRSHGAQQPLVAAVRAAMGKLDNSIPLSNILSMDQVISASVAQPRLTMSLTSGFAALALLLAAIGVYGVMAHSVWQRRQELAIRIAIGASPREVLTLVARQSLALVVLGVAFGLAGSFVITRLFSAILFHVGAHDLVTYTIAVGTLIVVAFAACYVPARRATTVDPVVALREG